MAEYRTIRMSFWNDPYIEELCAEEKLLYLYLFTSPHTNNLGILEITRRKIAFESGLPVEAVSKGIARFEADGKAVTDGNMVWLTNFVKNQTSTSGKLIKGLCELLAETGSEKIRSAVCKRYPALFGGMDAVSNGTDTASKGRHTVSIPYPYGTDTYSKGMDRVGIPSGEKEGESGRGSGSGKTRARGKKPSAPEPEKDRYGENGNVLLTRPQYENLCARFGTERTGKTIALLDLHIGAKGRDEYKDHNLALQKWAFDAVKEREARQARASPGQQRAGLSRNGNTDAGGGSRDYGQSIIPDDWGLDK